MSNEWIKIDTVPRDGTKVDLCWMENGVPQETYEGMEYDKDATNAAFPGVTGFWVFRVLGAVRFTWSEAENSEGDEYGPTHWRKHQPKS